jgi:hypothetical protein
MGDNDKRAEDKGKLLFENNVNQQEVYHGRVQYRWLCDSSMVEQTDDRLESWHGCGGNISL